VLTGVVAYYAPYQDVQPPPYSPLGATVGQLGEEAEKLADNLVKVVVGVGLGLAVIMIVTRKQ
jgi:hypothetical protein